MDMKHFYELRDKLSAEAQNAREAAGITKDTDAEARWTTRANTYERANRWLVDAINLTERG